MAGFCVFGGAFDPPHVSHRRIAEEVLASRDLEEFIVMPCGDHPLKPACEADGQARLRMCRQNFAGIERVVISDLEVLRAGKSYSAETLAQLRAGKVGHSALYLLIGSDNVQGLPDWHDYERLFELAEILVFPRLGHPCDAQSLTRTRLRPEQQRHLLAGVLAMEPDAVQSREIRRLLHAGEVSPWLLPSVAAEIDTEGLYSDDLA